MLVTFLLLSLIYISPAKTQFSPSPRWGAASMVKDSVLYIHGGKTNPTNLASYNSGPVTNDLFSLDLSKSFQASQPPWNYLSGSANSSTSQGPAIAFHSLSALSSSSALSFGGDGGPSMPLSTLADSAWILNLTSSTSASWMPQPPNWASEPIRRMYHAATFDESRGDVWITGGQKVDGSAILSDAYTFQATPSFQPLPSSTSPLPQIYGHGLFQLPNGALIVIGGAALGSVSPLSVVYLYNITSSTPGWSLVNTTGTAPSPRRNFAGAVIGNGQVLIHGGTSSAGDTPDQVLADGFVLDTAQESMAWTEIPSLSSLGARTDHLIAASGNQALFAFGWGSGGAVNNSISIFNTDTATFVDTWAASDSAPSGTAPGTASPTGPSPTGTFPHPSSTVTGPNSSNSSGANPGSPSTGISQHSTAIALATVFGLLALVAAVGGLTYATIKRREERRGGAFHLIRDGKGGDDHVVQGDSPARAAQPERVHMAGSPWSRNRLSFLPAVFGGHRSRARDRMDMLAGEEDSQIFDPYSHPIDNSSLGYRPRPRRETTQASGTSFGSSISNWYGLATRRNWGDFVSHSVSALRLVGGASYGDQSARSGPLPVDPFSDDMAMRGQYKPVEEESVEVEDLSHRSSSHPRPPDLSVITPASSELHLAQATHPQALPPALTSKSATSTLRATSPSQPSQTHRESSDSSSGHLASSQILGNPIRRSDSWWTRFSLSSLSPSSPRASTHEPITMAFRDPNPPPRLLPIKEGSQTSPDTAGTATTAGEQVSGRRSRSSYRTIDSDAIERMAGNMDVIQRIESNSSRQTHSSLDDSENPVTIVSSPQAIAQEFAVSGEVPGPRTRSQSVADRVLHWERRTPPEDAGRPRRRSHNYGLAPRGSLYIANPDHGRQAS